jgi:hypothetical protein
MSGTARPTVVGEGEWGEFDLVLRGQFGTSDGWSGEAVFEERPEPGDGGGPDSDTGAPPEPVLERVGEFEAGTEAG